MRYIDVVMNKHNLSKRLEVKLQNLYSWNQFYTILGTPNRARAKQVQDQIKILLQTS